MLSALLPGVREFRTPLVTGLLWAACLWLLFGPTLADSTSTRDLADRFDSVPLSDGAWLAAAMLLVYLVGSLLTVRTSPLRWIADRSRPRFAELVRRLDEDRCPAKRRHQLVWRFWRARFGSRNPCSRVLRGWAEGQQFDAVDGWLYNAFDSMAMDGRVPVMRSVDGGCSAPTGFEAFYRSDSVQGHPSGMEGDDLRHYLAGAFVREVKEELPAVEARIQMRFPEVYAEIDRLKVEAELRMSIFWPLLLLAGTLAFVWSPWALVSVVLPPLLVREGSKRAREALDKTWGALVAGEVTSPILDAMDAADDAECKDFGKRYRRQDHQPVERHALARSSRTFTAPQLLGRR